MRLNTRADHQVAIHTAVISKMLIKLNSQHRPGNTVVTDNQSLAIAIAIAVTTSCTVEDDGSAVKYFIVLYKHGISQTVTAYTEIGGH